MDHPLYRITGCKVIEPFVVSVRFDDGVQRQIDFRPVLRGELYGALRDRTLFEQVRIDPDTWTLVWPNGADFDPATLHDWPDVGPRMIDMARGWAEGEPSAADVRGATRGRLRIIGIDCATNEAARGLALGVRDGHELRLAEATVAGKDRPSHSIVEGWLAASEATVVIAIDAPLVWPRHMAGSLDGHSAGATIDTPPDAMFRRATDLFVQREIGKTPLDVGADRIARTAHAALRLLGSLRASLGAEIPLAWDPAALDGHAAIEVYPAATLIAHGIRSTRYKEKKDPIHVEGRREIVAALRQKMMIPTRLVTALSDNADVLDASVCVLAAEDFIAGRATPPPDRSTAEREGWIWTAPRRGPAYTAPDG